jgi:phage repressor protein C with HTH and peptisase S24 domain
VIGERLRETRKLRGLTQLQLAHRTGIKRHLISMVEHGKSGLSPANLSAAAQALRVSVDYLFGLTDDPTPAAQLASRVRALEDDSARAGALDEGDFVGVWEVATAAGGGAEVDRERVIGRIKFRRAWLTSRGLAAGDCRIIQVLGESMEPTLVDGCSILVNHASRRRHLGHIYVVRTEDGLVVQRAGRDPAGVWQLVSDNPDKLTWPNRPWPPDAVIVGEVRWAARTFT